MFEARFQSFDDPKPAETGPRVRALRDELSKRGLSGFILPRADRHQNEYVPPSEERLAWLTGFTGSAGTTIVLGDRAALFVDGRYTLQARGQIDQSVFAIERSAELTPERWIELNIASNDISAAAKSRSRPRKLHHRAWNRIDRTVRSLSLMA
jgi:Xaa-Pro aminopeptidase